MVPKRPKVSLMVSSEVERGKFLTYRVVSEVTDSVVVAAAT